MRFSALSVLVVALATQTQAVMDIYMTISDSNNKNVGTATPGNTIVPNGIQLDTYSFGSVQTVNFTSPSSTTSERLSAGKLAFNTFTLTKAADVNSPVILNRMAVGFSHTINVYFYRVVAGNGFSTQRQYMELQFREAGFTAQSFSSGGTEGQQTETLSFHYGAMQISYTPTKTNGTSGAPVTSGWSVIHNGPEVDMVPRLA
ncbi:hypothetical protein ANO11243_092900 [Dothideomycetidae sp. 11243]|nr:hypothetical protein ANO11243_092900 [fungal sp. No.11243]